MGQRQSTCDQFYSKYMPNNKGYLLLNLNHSTISPQNEVMYVQMYCKTYFQFLDRLRKYQRGGTQSRFHIQIQDLYYHQFGRYSTLIAVLPKTGLPLMKILRNRNIYGALPKHFKEADANYMIECGARGLRELQEIQESRFILSSTSILFCLDGFFRVFYIPRPPGDFCTHYQLSFLSIDSNTCHFQQISDNWVKFLKKMDSDFHRRSTNLLSLGLLALHMLDNNFKIEELFNLHGQFIYARVLAKINQVKDQRLKWRIWVLTNQYQKERMDIYKDLDPLFDRQDIPSRLLLKDTSLQYDLKYAQDVLLCNKLRSEVKTQPIKTVITHLISTPSQLPTFCPIIKQECKIAKIISQPPPKMPIIRFFYHNKPPTSDLMTASCPIPKINISQSLTLSKELQLSIERNLPINKLKSQMSDETQHSLVKNQEPLHSLKDVDTTTRIVSKVYSLSKQAVQTGPHQETQEEKEIQDHEHSHLLSSQGESIIFMDVDGSDRDPQQATQEIDDFFQDIRAKSYAIDRHIQRIDEPPTPAPEPYLSANILQDIIREQSFQQSQMGDIDLMSQQES